MPRRRDECARVLGPTWLPSQGYWRIVVITPQAPEPRDRRSTKYYREEADAIEVVQRIEQRLERLNGCTVEQAIEGYREHLKAKDTGSISYNETIRRLRLFFPNGKALISTITPEAAKGFYDKFRLRRKANGDPISVAYHRAALINARSLFKWCVSEGYLSENPLRDVEGIGKRNAGKEQHTGDETRLLYAYCLDRADTGDKAALGVLMALLMALRSSDITRRVVRDVDLDGTVLKVTKGKTQRSNRPRRIPLVLQPMLRKLTEGRGPFEPLFKTPYTKSGHHTQRWLQQALEKFCAAAGVPRVVPHALKGTAGSLLAETGELADRIADHLSHEETGTTRRHYVAAGALEEAQAERALKVIAGGKR